MESAITRRINRSINNTKVVAVSEIAAVFGTSVGRVRNENEDRAVVSKITIESAKSAVYCYLLSDGMGGMSNGSLASSMAISKFLTSFKSYLQDGKKSIEDSIDSSVQDSSDYVFRNLKGNGGATLSGIVIDSSLNIYLLNIGDSRVYDLSKNHLSLLTTDDDVQNALANIEGLSLNADLIKRNGLTKYIGMEGGFDFSSEKISPDGDLFLSSDGLHSVGDDVLFRLSFHSENTPQFVQRCIHQSNWFGGKDNATGMLISIEQLETLDFSTDNSYELIEIWDVSGQYSFALEKVIVESSDKKKPIRKNRKNVKSGKNKELFVSPNKKEIVKDLFSERYDDKFSIDLKDDEQTKNKD